MNFILNILWLILGGLVMAFEYFVAGLLLMITIIGIPFGLQIFKLGILALWPFGRSPVYVDYPGGCLSGLLNLVWLILGGFWIALSHLFFGVILSITIIGIPFGMQHFKLAGLALFPFGKQVDIKR